MIRFAAPELLAGLALLALVLLAVRGREVTRGALALRLASLALVVLAAAGTEVRRQTPDLTVILAADRSDSIGPDGARLIRSFLDEVRASAGPAHRVGLVTFGADAVLEEAPNALPRLALAAHVRTDGTDLAAAIERALQALPDGAPARIVVLTDGQATAGDLGPVLAAVRARGVDLAIVPVATEVDAEVMVEEVRMPATVAVGERLPITVVIRSTAAASVALRVWADGTTLLSRDLDVRVGRTAVDLEALASRPGLLRVEAAIEATPDAEPGNNLAFALSTVTGPPYIVYAAEEIGPLAGALRAQGLAVRVVAPTHLPAAAAGYQGAAAVVLDDVPAFGLSPGQLTALREYVRGGGGLVVVGGLRSFGIGGYAGTPLEEALPVSMDVRHRLAMPSVAVVVVLDASGSMAAFGQELAKVELAKETAQSLVDLLGERDLVGVIAFDQAPRWLIRPAPASQRARILDAVSRIKAGGGTNLHPALAEARAGLRGVEAKVKHVIVLSDGHTDPGDFQGLTTAMAAERITVSTVAIGRDADVEIMRQIAAWGRGRAYVTRDLYGIPQILTAEAMLATRAYIVEERFVPKAAEGAEVLADLGRPPALRGYVATTARPAAQVALISPQDDPVLATWAFGLGRAVAITTDARFRWTAEWAAWPQTSRFWSQAVRWAMARETGALDARAEVADGRLRVVVDARAPDGAPLVTWTAAAAVTGAGGEAGRTTLVQTRPGWYEGSLPLPPPGAYLVAVDAWSEGRHVGRAALPLALPYSPELRAVGLNRPLIAHLVEAGSARVITTVREALTPPDSASRRPQPVWPLLGGAALAAFVAEVTIRRIPAIAEQWSRLLAAAAAWVRRGPPSGQGAEEAEYAAADRWRVEDVAESAARAASMAAAARLYIARLRRMQADEAHEDTRADGW